MHSRVAKWVGDHAIAVSRDTSAEREGGVQTRTVRKPVIVPPRLNSVLWFRPGVNRGMDANAAVHSSGVVTSVLRGQNAYSRDGGPKRGPFRPVTAVKYKVTTCRIVRKKAARDAKRSHDTRCPHGHPLGLAPGPPFHAHTLAHSLRRPRWRVGWKGNSIPFLRFLMNPDGTLL